MNLCPAQTPKGLCVIRFQALQLVDTVILRGFLLVTCVCVGGGRSSLLSIPRQTLSASVIKNLISKTTHNLVMSDYLTLKNKYKTQRNIKNTFVKFHRVKILSFSRIKTIQQHDLKADQLKRFNNYYSQVNKKKQIEETNNNITHVVVTIAKRCL